MHTGHNSLLDLDTGLTLAESDWLFENVGMKVIAIPLSSPFRLDSSVIAFQTPVMVTCKNAAVVSSQTSEIRVNWKLQLQLNKITAVRADKINGK